MPSLKRTFSQSGDTLPIAPKLRYDYRWGRSMAANEREFDIILFGATGFTGKLVAEYLLRQYGINEGLRWAIAGRNPGKLKEIATSLGTGGCEVPRLEADSNSAKDMNRLAAQAKVVCTTVGPYAKYGSLLLSACVERGTHYCDLTAEIPWMVRMMNEHQAQA
ncbi:MAG: saccharopine dehydrogenase NADP-binding domain-containing protein, partial [Candidatus Binatia bacterium]|nr:saccharopine dehydrogenase NADP-binding domain-containing protein [Candidatus Binatia bacterium]